MEGIQIVCVGGAHDLGKVNTIPCMCGIPLQEMRGLDT